MAERNEEEKEIGRERMLNKVLFAYANSLFLHFFVTLCVFFHLTYLTMF